MSNLQTLDRGVQALKFISQNPHGITIADLAAKLDVHRSIAHRIIATLESHALVTRPAGGAIFLGTGLLELASHFHPQLRSLAQPLLSDLAQKTQATAFISVAEGDQCVVIMVEEPAGGLLRVGYRLGSRHPLSLGAAGIAILSGRPETDSDEDVVREARSSGYCVTRGVLQKGAVGVASPIFPTLSSRSGLEACVGVVAM